MTIINELETKAILGTFVVSAIVLSALELANVALHDRNIWNYCHDPTLPMNWCEAKGADLTHFMVEPANARSNYLYFMFGVYCIFWGLLTHQVNKRKLVVDVDKACPKPERISVATIQSGTDSDESSNDSNTQGSRNSDRLDGNLDVDDVETGDGFEEPPCIEEGINDNLDSSVSSSGKTQSSESKLHTLQALNALHRFPILPISYGISLVLLGFGSWWYHASECRVANRWDAAGMFAVTCFPAFYCLVALIPYFQHPIRVFFVPAMQIFFHVGEFMIDFEDHIMTQVLILSSFSLMIVLTLVRRRTHTFRYWLVFACLGSAAIAFALWNLDKKGIMCQPKLGHPMWHIGTCMACIFGGLYLRSERPKEEKSENIDHTDVCTPNTPPSDESLDKDLSEITNDDQSDEQSLSSDDDSHEEQASSNDDSPV